MNTRRKLAALVATTALLVGSLAMAGAVSADSSPHGWAGNGWPNTTCTDAGEGDTMHWVFTGGSKQNPISNVVFHWPTGNSVDMTQHSAGSYYADVAFFDPTGMTGADIYVTYDGSFPGKAVLTLSHCNGGETPPSSTAITSTVKDGEGATIDVQNPALGTVTAHDTAAITITGDVTDAPKGSSVQFFFWNDNMTCSGDPSASSDQGDVGGESSVINVDSSNWAPAADFSQGPLGPGEYSFQAVFTSGDESTVDSAVGDCEPFVVLTQTTSGETTSETTTLPPTAEFGDTSNPTDHSWILIAALGMILGSLLVLTPARARNKR